MISRRLHDGLVRGGYGSFDFANCSVDIRQLERLTTS